MKDHNNMKDNPDVKISIKNKKRYFKAQSFIRLGFFLVIAIISGAISGKYVVEKIVKQAEINGLISGRSAKGEDSLQKEFSSGINKAALSLVTISDNEDNLSSDNNAESNITGVVIDKKGYIITNFSKIKDFQGIYVKLPSIASKPIKGTFISADEATDMAVIKIEANGLVPITIANEESFREGDFVVAIGNAVSDDFIGVAMPGMITSTNNKITDSNNRGSYRVIQTSAIINSDNTGGALCNINGELIGFSSTKLTEKFNREGSFYALGVRGVKSISAYLISLTDILGINGGSIINDSKTGAKGVYIDNVNSEGYAAKAGLKPTDIIIGIDGGVIETPEDIYYAIKDKKNGDTIECDILRDGEETKMNITLD
ncbi:S1C family serine protease [Clostridium sp. LP20]|uniref:S1C family serine protease n=1 Tax=Clostridium sp. LP20 TaxID=3418665 RepID=UPI003EE50D18